MFNEYKICLPFLIYSSLNILAIVLALLHALKYLLGHFHGGLVTGPLYSSAGSLGPIPGEGTRFHRSQLRVHMPKTWHSQMYKNWKKKKKENILSESITCFHYCKSSIYVFWKLCIYKYKQKTVTLDLEITTINIYLFSASFVFSKLRKYDNTLIGDLENTEQSYIYFHYILQSFLSR